MRKMALAIGCLLAGGVQAQNVDPAVVRGCFSDAFSGDGAPQCLGQAAEGCLAGGDNSTLGIVQCIQGETALWDGLLNEQYGQVRATLNAQNPALGTALRDAQRAWIAYRDAECALEHARWGDASLRSIVAANCMMAETAERAIELRDKKGN
ncbi:MAG: lysozyme inhibitor LprI family protein [Sulfitobacter sp.]